MKYFAFIILFLTFSHYAGAQFSISGGYDHRSEDVKLSLKNHFTTPSKGSFYHYHIGYLKAGYRINKRAMLTCELGFSKKSIDCYQKTQSDLTTWFETYYTTNYYRSTVSYSSFTINLGINRTFEWKGLLLKKVTHAIVFGAFFQPEFLVNFKDENKTVQTVITHHLNNSNQPDVVLQDETTSVETSLFQANKGRFNVGLGLTKRTQFHSIFIEFKVKIGVALFKRITQSSAVSNNDEQIISNKNFYPVLETGIGFGYVFNKRKMKPVTTMSIN